MMIANASSTTVSFNEVKNSTIFFMLASGNLKRGLDYFSKTAGRNVRDPPFTPGAIFQKIRYEPRPGHFAAGYWAD
jgi:hypothetical protein